MINGENFAGCYRTWYVGIGWEQTCFFWKIVTGPVSSHTFLGVLEILDTYAYDVQLE
jgi:hypothetical protein